MSEEEKKEKTEDKEEPKEEEPKEEEPKEEEEQPKEDSKDETGELLTEIKGMLLTLQTSIDQMNQVEKEEEQPIEEEPAIDLEEDLIQLDD